MKTLFVIALVLYLSGCASTASLFGLESVASANDRQAELAKYADTVAEKQAVAKQQETEEAIIGAAAIAGPEAQATVRQVFEAKGPVVVAPTPKPEPKPDPSEGILEKYAPELALILAVGGAYAKLRVEDKKTASQVKTEINTERDSKRRERGEAVTPDEAARKGYFEEGKTT